MSNEKIASLSDDFIRIWDIKEGVGIMKMDPRLALGHSNCYFTRNVIKNCLAIK